MCIFRNVFICLCAVLRGWSGYLVQKSYQAMLSVGVVDLAFSVDLREARVGRYGHGTMPSHTDMTAGSVSL